jgi:hypothetical protein
MRSSTRWKRARGTATSANWNTGLRAWRTEAGQPVVGRVAVANALPAGWPDEFAAIRGHRVGAAPLTCILVSADNRNGSKNQKVHRLRAVTMQGSTVPCVGVWEVTESWSTGSQPSGLSTEAINQGRRLHDDMMDLSVGLPGTVSQHWLASNESLDSVGTAFRLPSTREATQGKAEIESKR